MKRGCLRVSPFRADVMGVAGSRNGALLDASALLTHLSLSLSLLLGKSLLTALFLAPSTVF